MKRIQTLLIGALVTLLWAPQAWSYDAELAASYAQLFAPVQGAAAGKALHLLTPEKLMERIANGKEIVAIDVRTPDESRVYGVTLPGSLVIPIHTLFDPENLARIPTDKTVVIVCKSGTRATAAGTALRHIGFANVFVLKGGLQGMATYLDPKNARIAQATH